MGFHARGCPDPAPRQTCVRQCERQSQLAASRKTRKRTLDLSHSLLRGRSRETDLPTREGTEQTFDRVDVEKGHDG